VTTTDIRPRASPFSCAREKSSMPGRGVVAVGGMTASADRFSDAMNLCSDSKGMGRCAARPPLPRRGPCRAWSRTDKARPRWGRPRPSISPRPERSSASFAQRRHASHQPERFRRLAERLAPLLDLSLPRALAYRIQEIAFGGLSKATLRRLASLAAEFESDRRIATPAQPRIKPGARLVREWHGRTHAVVVTEDKSGRRSGCARTRRSSPPRVDRRDEFRSARVRRASSEKEYRGQS
jgi:Protein of unknown function (DUF2924)